MIFLLNHDTVCRVSNSFDPFHYFQGNCLSQPLWHVTFKSKTSDLLRSETVKHSCPLQGPASEQSDESTMHSFHQQFKEKKYPSHLWKVLVTRSRWLDTQWLFFSSLHKPFEMWSFSAKSCQDISISMKYYRNEIYLNTCVSAFHDKWFLQISKL